MGYCTHESRLVLRSAEIQPFIPRFVRFSCAIDLCRLIVQICTPTNTNTHTHTHHQLYTYRLDTHTPTVLRETSFRAFSLHTPQLRNTNAPASYPSQQCLHLHTYACVCARARMLHRETTTGAFSLRFSKSSHRM